MSFTLATLKTAVQDYLETNEETFVSQLDTFITQAEERIFKVVQLPDQRKNVQGNLSTSNRFLATPTDWLGSFSLAVIDSNEYTYLDFKHNSFIKEYSSNATTTGKPKYYSIFDQSSFEVSPVPDQGYTVELHYLARPASLTSGASSGTTYLSTEAPDTLLYACLVEGAIFLKLPQAEIGILDSKFNEALSRLKNLGEGRDTRDEMRYDSLRINVT
jgi:hypothetical protein